MKENLNWSLAKQRNKCNIENTEEELLNENTGMTNRGNADDPTKNRGKHTLYIDTHTHKEMRK